MPAGVKDETRAFYSVLLGLAEREKPAALAARGGALFGLPDRRQPHLGVEEPLGPRGKAHPAFIVGGLDGLAKELDAGAPVP